MFCVFEGKVVQIAIDNEFRTFLKTNAKLHLNEYYEVVSVKGGKYFIVVNSSETGFEVIQPYY